MDLYLKSKNYLRMIERRLDRARRELNVVNRNILEVSQRITETNTRVEVLYVQTRLFEQQAEFTRNAFFDSRRQKAIVLSEIAGLKYQSETLENDLLKLEAEKQRSVLRIAAFNGKCVKFQSYLEGLSRKQRLKLDAYQEGEIEELSIHGGVRNQNERRG
ncbi:hypothetical protein BD65_2671 [Yersinia ruckeri]|uniref:hypothetical protein n=2 Tax=Yersinia ruckeri TaxID=29486 RepID=UPI0005ABE54F|nr:hypothetical protein [Yersinia ruckeri]AJI94890.1 hypothetical protein BD65_2671 [Yersinia ruckeri]MCW6566888.1 hypothetical protein [Yersinia ruckeri]